MSGGPAYATATLVLSHGESACVERGGLVMLSDGVRARASTGGGVLRAAVRAQLADESFVFTEVSAEVDGAWVTVAPPYPGDACVVEVDDGHGVLATSGSLLAYSEQVQVSTRVGGLGQVLMREGVTLLRLSGRGLAVLTSYGAIQQVHLDEHQSVTVDTGHLVAWSESVRLRVGLLEGPVTATLTGEGLVARFTGPGRVWVQTRAERGTRDWLLPQRAQNQG